MLLLKVVAIFKHECISKTCVILAENEYEIELPKKKIALEARKVREIYEIEEEDEK